MFSKWTRFWLRHPFRYCYRHKELKQNDWERWCHSCYEEKTHRKDQRDEQEKAVLARMQCEFEEARNGG